jgi:predicted nicotinamide N-methyase
MTPEEAVGQAAAWTRVPFVGEITIRMPAASSGLWDLWDATGREPPPFWAFPWAGGQALARYILDHPDAVRGRRILDVASGSGLVAIAAARAGAATVVAGDIDPNAIAAIGVNAAANGVAVTARAFDLAADDAGDAEVVLAADVFYQVDLADRALAFLRAAARSGADVLTADPGRAFFPAGFLTPVASYEVPVITEIETATVRRAAIYRLAADFTDNLSLTDNGDS